jgi:hypothetical protein
MQLRRPTCAPLWTRSGFCGLPFVEMHPLGGRAEAGRGLAVTMEGQRAVRSAGHITPAYSLLGGQVIRGQSFFTFSNYLLGGLLLLCF